MRRWRNELTTRSLRWLGKPSAPSALCYKEVDPKQLDLETQDGHGIFAYEREGFTLVGIAGIKDIIR